MQPYLDVVIGIRASELSSTEYEILDTAGYIRGVCEHAPAPDWQVAALSKIPCAMWCGAKVVELNFSVGAEPMLSAAKVLSRLGLSELTEKLRPLVMTYEC